MELWVSLRVCVSDCRRIGLLVHGEVLPIRCPLEDCMFMVKKLQKASGKRTFVHVVVEHNRLSATARTKCGADG